MNKILFLISALALVACSNYTVKNDTAEGIKVGSTVISAGGCEKFSDGFMGFGSDWPQTITKEDESATSATGEADKEWSAGNYVVNADGSIATADEMCETAEEEAEAEEESEGDKMREGIESLKKAHEDQKKDEQSKPDDINVAP